MTKEEIFTLLGISGYNLALVVEQVQNLFSFITVLLTMAIAIAKLIKEIKAKENDKKDEE